MLDKIEDRPDELYARVVATLSRHLDRGGEVTLRVGGQRVTDSRFLEGAVRYDSIVEIAARFPLGP